MTLSIAVCIKPVPSEEAYKHMSIDPVTKVVKRENSESVINPLDLHALEAGVALKERLGANVVAIAMAPSSAEINLRQALALGADQAYLISDYCFSGSDTLTTSYILACALKRIGSWDLILCGSYSSDGGTAQVPVQIGEWLEIPHFHRVVELEYLHERFEFKSGIDNKYMKWQSETPVLLSVDRRLNKPRYMTFRGIRQAKNKEIYTINNSDLCLDVSLLGLDGSPTKMGELHQFSADRHGKTMKGDVDELAGSILDKLTEHGVHF